MNPIDAFVLMCLLVSMGLAVFMLGKAFVCPEGLLLRRIGGCICMLAIVGCIGYVGYYLLFTPRGPTA